MSKSRQRLGDDPRDHDEHSTPINEEFTDVSSIRPEAPHSIREAPAPSNFTPWKIYPKPPPPHWHWKETGVVSADGSKAPGSEGFVFEECEIPGELEGWSFELDTKGVYQVYEKKNSKLASTLNSHPNLFKDIEVGEKTPAFDIPDLREYFMDLEKVLNVISDGPTKSFAFRRLKYLSGKFTMYSLLNEFQELADMKVGSYLLVSVAPS